MLESLTRAQWLAIAGEHDAELVEAMVQGAYARQRRDRPALPPWEACTDAYRENYRQEIRWALTAAKVSGFAVVKA